MRAISGKELKHRDSMARKRNRRFAFKIFGWLFLLSAFTAGGGYLFFFTPVLQIRDVVVNGLEEHQRDAVLAYVNSMMDEQLFDRIQVNKNILVFDSARVTAAFLAKFPELKSATAEKKMFHTLKFDFTQRTALGVWCSGERCVYFDDAGGTWGRPVRSSGFLLLTVQDLRSSGKIEIAPDVLAAVKQVADIAPKLDIRIKKVTIPADFFNELTVLTNKGYVLLLSMDSNIPEQLRILGALLEKKRDDKSFAPSVIDLRIEGRIYYK